MTELIFALVFAGFTFFMALANRKHRIDRAAQKRMNEFEKKSEEIKREVLNKSLSDNIDDLNVLLKDKRRDDGHGS